MGRAKAGLSPEEALAGALVALRGANLSDPADVRAAVDEATRELEGGLAGKSHYSKAEAARLLDVSAPTLDKWVRSGLLPTQDAPGSKRKMIPSHPLLDLAAEVKELRRLGRNRGLLAEALSRLEQEDPRFAEQFAEFYGAALAAGDDHEFVSAAPGPDWDPDDESDPNALDFADDD
jgi:transposase-like protein